MGDFGILSDHPSFDEKSILTKADWLWFSFTRTQEILQDPLLCLLSDRLRKFPSPKEMYQTKAKTTAVPYPTFPRALKFLWRILLCMASDSRRKSLDSRGYKEWDGLSDDSQDGTSVSHFAAFGFRLKLVLR